MLNCPLFVFVSDAETTNQLEQGTRPSQRRQRGRTTSRLTKTWRTWRHPPPPWRLPHRRQSKKSDDKRSHSSSQQSDVEIRIAKLEKELQRQRDLARKESTKGRSPSRGSTKSRAQSHTSKGRTSRPPTPRSSNKRPWSESRSSSKKSKSGREEPTKAKYPKKDNKAKRKSRSLP